MLSVSTRLHCPDPIVCLPSLPPCCWQWGARATYLQVSAWQGACQGRLTKLAVPTLGLGPSWLTLSYGMDLWAVSSWSGTLLGHTGLSLLLSNGTGCWLGLISWVCGHICGVLRYLHMSHVYCLRVFICLPGHSLTHYLGH